MFFYVDKELVPFSLFRYRNIKRKKVFLILLEFDQKRENNVSTASSSSLGSGIEKKFISPHYL